MHTRVKLIAALLLAAPAALLAPALPAAADVGPGTGNGGSNTGGRYGAWAWYVTTGGGDGATGTSNDCDLPDAPGEEAHYEYFVTHFGDETIVSLVCVGVLLRQAHPEPIPVLEGWERDFLDVVWSETVRPVPLDDLVAHAIASLDPDPPAILTNLHPGVDGLVNLPVEFRLAGDTGVPPGVAAEDGPVRVVLSAEPDLLVPTVWHTGDGRRACEDGGAPGVCTHEYTRSSNGQHHEGLPRDQYRVTAGITYLGHYDVFLAGVRITGDDIGNVQRTAELPLPVDEAQAVNTHG